jgi:hypothetical protein
MLHVDGYIGGKGWLGREEDVDVKGMNVIA